MSATVNKSNWSIYLLVSERGRTYVGATTNVKRRLRQHNGEIRGGARATRKEANWILVACVSGFTSRSQAYRWEALVKKRSRGKKQRIENMVGICLGNCPAPRKKTGRVYDVPVGLSLILGGNMLIRGAL